MMVYTTKKLFIQYKKIFYSSYMNDGEFITYFHGYSEFQWPARATLVAHF